MEDMTLDKMKNAIKLNKIAPRRAFGIQEKIPTILLIIFIPQITSSRRKSPHSSEKNNLQKVPPSA